MLFVNSFPFYSAFLRLFREDAILSLKVPPPCSGIGGQPQEGQSPTGVSFVRGALWTGHQYKAFDLHSFNPAVSYYPTN